MKASETFKVKSQHSALEVIHGAAKPYIKRLMTWICPEKRVSTRYVAPPLIAYLGPVRGSAEFTIGDLSVGGFYMVTEERWIPGTSFPVTFERTDPVGKGRMLTVSATVVRTGKDGVGFSFVPPTDEKCFTDAATKSSTVVDLTKLAEFLSELPLAQPDAEPLRRAS